MPRSINAQDRLKTAKVSKRASSHPASSHPDGAIHAQAARKKVPDPKRTSTHPDDKHDAEDDAPLQATQSSGFSPSQVDDAPTPMSDDDGQYSTQNSDDADFVPVHDLIYKRKATPDLAPQPAVKKRKLDSGQPKSARVKVESKAGAVKTEKPVPINHAPSKLEGEAADVKPNTPRTPKDQYLQVMLEFAPHVEMAFHDLSMARSTAIAVLRKVEKNSFEGEYSVLRFRTLFENLLFARLPQESKEKWQTDEGKRASKLRRVVVLSCLSMARKNLFRDFSSKLYPDDAKMPIPMWLTKKMHDTIKVKDPKEKRGFRMKRKYRNYILTEYVGSTVDKFEKRNDSKVEYFNRMAVCRVGYPSRAETGDYILSYLYRSLLSMFTTTRRSAKIDFFTSIGYLFLDWTEFPECDVHNSDVDLIWAAPMERDAEQGFAWEESLTVTYATQTDGDDNGNVACFTEFFEKLDDITLLVRHDVMVRSAKSKASQRRRDGSVRQTWARSINLGVVIVRLLQLCCGFGPSAPAFDLLRAHKECIRLVYRMARALRRALSQMETRTILTYHPEGYVTLHGAAGTVGSHSDAGEEDGQHEDVKDDEGTCDSAGEDREPILDVPRDDDVDGAAACENDGVTNCATARGNDDAAENPAGMEDDDGSNGHTGGDDPGVPGNADTADCGAGNDDELGGVDAAAGDGEGTAGTARNRGCRDECEEDVAVAGTAAEGADEGEDNNGNVGKAVGNGADEEDMFDDLDNSPDRQDEAVAVADIARMFMGKDMATTFNLKQATCTIDGRLYWSEHIGAENAITARYGHIPFSMPTQVEPEDERNAHCSEDDIDDDEEDFGFD